MKEKTKIAAPVEDYSDELTNIAPVKRRPGAPSLYSPQLVERILDGLASGKSLRRICGRDGVPSRDAVVDWLINYPEFSAQYARARDIGLDELADELLELGESATPLNANAVRVNADIKKWYLSKLAPKRYGDQLAITGADGGPVQVAAVDDRELARRVALLLSQVSELPVIEGKSDDVTEG